MFIHASFTLFAWPARSAKILHTILVLNVDPADLAPDSRESKRNSPVLNDLVLRAETADSSSSTCCLGNNRQALLQKLRSQCGFAMSQDAWNHDGSLTRSWENRTLPTDQTQAGWFWIRQFKLLL